MCVASRGSMAEAQAEAIHAKPMCSSQAVGLLAILADSGSASLPILNKQKIFRHAMKIAESPQTCMMPCQEKKVQQGVIKKVRFAPDVVEPSGDSRAYRCRKNVNKESAFGERQGHNEMVTSSSLLSVKSSYHDRNCGKAVKPTLPANRMLLYKGMQCYRSKMMPCL